MTVQDLKQALDAQLPESQVVMLVHLDRSEDIDLVAEKIVKNVQSEETRGIDGQDYNNIILLSD